MAGAIALKEIGCYNDDSFDNVVLEVHAGFASCQQMYGDIWKY